MGQFTIIDCDQDTTKMLAQLKAEGITDIIRYDDRFPSGNWKQIHSPEVHAIRDAGLRLGIVYEGAGSTLSTFSEDNGYLDASYSRKMAASRGQPDGSAVYFAVDFDPPATAVTQRIIPYFHGVARALEQDNGLPKIVAGAYASGYVCRTLKTLQLIKYSWVTCSGGFTGTKEYLAEGLQDLWQKQCDAKLLGLDIDYNVANRLDWGSFVPWGPPAIPPVEPAPVPITHDVAWLQGELKSAGWYKGQIDGDAGPLTLAAVIAYVEKAPITIQAGSVTA